MKILHRALYMSYMAACLLFFSKERIQLFLFCRHHIFQTGCVQRFQELWKIFVRIYGSALQ